MVAITELRNLPPDIRPFVEFKAMIEDREMDEKEVVAVLNIDTTTCYVPVFLRNPPTIDQLEKELAQQDAKLSSDSKEALSSHLKN